MSIEDLLEGFGEIEEHYDDYAMAEAYATGKVDEVFASDGEIARKLAKASRRDKFSLLSVPVMSRVDRMVVTAVKANDVEGEADESATKRIEQVYDANDLDVHYADLMRKTCTFGDAYVFVFPLQPDEFDDPADQSEDVTPADEELLAAGVEFIVHDPKNARMLYDTANPRRKRLWLWRWLIHDEGSDQDVWRVDVWYSDRVEHWVQLPNGSTTEPDGWAPWAEDDADGNEVKAPTEAHDFGEVPAFHHRTGLPYGTPVHAAGYGAQNAMIKMLVTQLDTSEGQGWPWRYRLLDPDADLDTGQGSPEWLDDTDAVAYQPGGSEWGAGPSTGQKQGPGAMTTYTGTREVGQLDSADPELFWGPAINYIKLMASLTRTPASHFWPEETKMGAAPSGVAREQEEAPLMASVQYLQKLQQAPLRESWMFVGRLLAIPLQTVGVQWAPLTMAKTVEDWTVVGLKQQYGVPVEQTLTEAGYTQEQAQEWQEEQEKAKAEMMDQMAALAVADGKDGDAAKRKEVAGQITGGKR